MSAVFKKLNLKADTEIFVLGAPESFEPEVAQLRGVAVRRSLAGSGPVTFAIAFVTRQPEVDEIAPALAGRAVGDPVIWFAYPKKSSTRYRSEIDRDHGWSVLGKAGFEPVRMVAIDEDWSAVRFRRVERIKTMTRDSVHALSAAGKAKSAANARKAPRKRTAVEKRAAGRARRRKA